MQFGKCDGLDMQEGERKSRSEAADSECGDIRMDSYDVSGGAVRRR